MTLRESKGATCRLSFRGSATVPKSLYPIEVLFSSSERQAIDCAFASSLGARLRGSEHD